jgi:hypothetical protein
MSRIPNAQLRSVVYLYPSVQAARAGKDAGGTGFIVACDLVGPWIQVYFVTCSHVALAAEAVRINTRSSGLSVMRLKPSNWLHHPDGDDLAVYPFSMRRHHDWFVVRSSELVTKTMMRAHDIGPGDDVYMIGRFLYHDGRESNTPAARFGNLAIMPSKIYQRDRGFYQESFLVECRSIPGFSGSPVFTQINIALPRPHATSTLDASEPGNPRLLPISSATNEVFNCLLGVDWGHILSKEVPVHPGMGVFYAPLSGMSAVVPAWRLQALLDAPKLVKQRAKET